MTLSRFSSHAALRAAPTLAALLVALVAAVPSPHPLDGPGSTRLSGDSAAVAAAVHAFHAALRAGDADAVREILSDDVQVAESGGVEAREEYLSHHLPADMAFAAAVAREPGPVHVTVVGDVAWAMSTSRTRGTFRDRSIDSAGAELMILSREGEAWRIRAIHWSSRQVR